MKAICESDVCREIILWMLFLGILCILVFGASVNVGFCDPEVSLARAWESAAGKWSFIESISGDFGLCIGIPFICLVLHSSFRNWKVRVGVMAIAFLVPVFSIGVVMLWVAVVSPLMVFSVVTGKADGEFYCERMLMLAAIGLSMLLWLVSGMFDFVRESRRRTAAKKVDDFLETPESAGPIKRLPSIRNLPRKNETPLC